MLKKKDSAALGITLILATLLAASPVASQTSSYRDTPSRYQFNLPAGEAKTTLRAFHTQSGVEILYLISTVEGVKTNAVVGEYTADEALTIMLRQTGLKHKMETRNFASVNPIVAKRARAGDGSSTGESEGRRPLYWRQPDANSEHHDLAEVVVTGTLIRGVLDVMAPLEVLTKRTARKTRYATVQDALRTLTFTSEAGPSEDFGTTGNFGRGTASNLRGLGPAATLVLVNGSRQAYSGVEGDFVDLGAIPWSAVDRIEVLPDGASALYGADAVAGVVNIITRTHVDGAETQVRLSSSEHLMAQLVGHSWGSGNGLLAYQYMERDRLPATAQAFSSSSDKRPLGGSDWRSTNSSPGNVLNPLTLVPEYGIAPANNTGAVFVDTLNLQNRQATADLLPSRSTHSVFLRGTQEFGERIDAVLDARASRRATHVRYFAHEQVLLIPPTNPHFLSPIQSAPFLLVGYSFLDDVGPSAASDVSLSTSAVFRGTLRAGRGWQISLSGSAATESMDFTVHNQINPEGLARALAGTETFAFNPFAPGSQSPETLQAIKMEPAGKARSAIRSAALVADGPVARVPNGMLKAAIGFEHRWESFRRSWPNVVDAGREIESVFGELILPVVGDPVDERGVPRLEVSIAARTERYSDFGTASNPKFGVRFAPTNTLKVRASYGRSYRAPRLLELNDENVAFLVAMPDPTSASGRSAALFMGGAREDLRPERASNTTLGLDLSFPWAEGFLASATAYSISYRDRIVRPGPPDFLQTLRQEAIWADVIQRNPSTAEIEAFCRRDDFRGSRQQCAGTQAAAIVDLRSNNLAATRVQGLDISLQQTFETPAGQLRGSLAGTYVDTFEQQISPRSGTHDIRDTVGYPNSLRLRGELEWARRGWEAALAVDWSDDYRDPERFNRHVNASWQFDARLSYRTSATDGLLSDMEVALNAANLFDAAPPFLDRESGYDAQAAEPTGRILSIYLEKHW